MGTSNRPRAVTNFRGICINGLMKEYYFKRLKLRYSLRSNSSHLPPRSGGRYSEVYYKFSLNLMQK